MIQLYLQFPDFIAFHKINKKFDNGIRLSYSKTEEVSSIDQIEHKLVKATLEYLNINGGVEITSVADIPSKGTGLGSSSSFTVGLINALNAFKGKYISAQNLGEQSCLIEINKCLEPIGKQDQYAAAYGGFNFIEFKQDGSVFVSPIIMNSETKKKLEENIIVFYTGITRSTSILLSEQTEVISKETKKQNTLKTMVSLTYQLRDELQNDNLNAFGETLHENWILKKSLLSNISSQEIDFWYNKAILAGATGGKILGAGAGGFLLMYAPIEKHDAIRAVLTNLKEVKIGFEPLGSRIIFYQ